MIENVEPRQSNHVSWNRGKSACRQWLIDRVGFQGDECLIWPFSLTRGYGSFMHLKKGYYAHRYMCELANGPPPTTGHEAAHSCGRGDQGCVHPKHLSWKTKTQNALDCRQHGTHAKHSGGRYGKLTTEQADQIRASGMKGRELAKFFGVHETTISNIRTGRSRNGTNKNPNTGYYQTLSPAKCE